MIEIIPAIDLLDGKCVRLHQGNYNLVTEFSSDPIKQALIWEGLGATRLHLVDLDGAKTGTPVNDSTIKAIKKRLSIPIQVGGGIRNKERAEELINILLDTSDYYGGFGKYFNQSSFSIYKGGWEEWDSIVNIPIK